MATITVHWNDDTTDTFDDATVEVAGSVVRISKEEKSSSVLVGVEGARKDIIIPFLSVKFFEVDEEA